MLLKTFKDCEEEFDIINNGYFKVFMRLNDKNLNNIRKSII